MQAQLTAGAYAVEPRKFVDGIPVFSAVDRYVENYQQIASDHMEVVESGEADNPFIEGELWRILEESTRRLLLQHVPAGAHILDVGVGLGRLIGPLRQYQRFGIDISMDYLGQARRSGIEVAFARIEDMPYANDYFDAVLVCDVLEHVLDLNQCCSEILRVLKPDGLLIVRVPYREDLSGYLSESNVYEYVHLRNFDEHSIRLFFERIMECSVLHIEQVAPHLVGAPRLRLRQLPATSPLYQVIEEAFPPPPPPLDIRQFQAVRCELQGPQGAVEPEVTAAPVAASEPPAQEHPLHVLQRAMAVNESEFVNWIYALRDRHPQWYARIAEHVVLGVEMNVIVRKPHRAQESSSSAGR